MENQNEMDTYYKGDNNAIAFSMRMRRREYWEAATKAPGIGSGSDPNLQLPQLQKRFKKKKKPKLVAMVQRISAAPGTENTSRRCKPDRYVGYV